MFRRVLVIVGALCLLGQGCLPILPTNPTQPTKDPGGQPSPDGLIPYHSGFGVLPGTPLSTTSTGVDPMTFTVNVPTLPEEMTVLREWNADPDATLVRNVTGALLLPAGVLGPEPEGEALSVRWRSADAFDWSADVTTHNVNFIRDGSSPVPVLRTGNADHVTDVARTFFTDHGVDVTAWGDPVARPYDVAFAQSRDGLPVVNADGTSALSAVVSTDAGGLNVMQGHFELPSLGMERSNYPTLALKDVLARLAAGGTNPLRQPGASVVIRDIVFAYVARPGEVNGAPRTYYLPVLWARGTATHNGTQTPYGTLVPLVKDDAFGL